MYQFKQWNEIAHTVSGNVETLPLSMTDARELVWSSLETAGLPELSMKVSAQDESF